MNENMNYQVGSTVEVAYGNQRSIVTVTFKDDDIKNGRPGFDGDSERGPVWAYDDQIVRVVKF